MPCQDAHQALPSMTGPQALQEARRVLGQGLASRGSWPRSTGARVPQTGRGSQPGQLWPPASRPVWGGLETVASGASLRQVCESKTHYGRICPRPVPVCSDSTARPCSPPGPGAAWAGLHSGGGGHRSHSPVCWTKVGVQGLWVGGHGACGGGQPRHQNRILTLQWKKAHHASQGKFRKNSISHETAKLGSQPLQPAGSEWLLETQWQP